MRYAAAPAVGADARKTVMGWQTAATCLLHFASRRTLYASNPSSSRSASAVKGLSCRCKADREPHSRSTRAGTVSSLHQAYRVLCIEARVVTLCHGRSA